MDYVAPNRQVFDDTTEGQPKASEDLVFDSTGIHALNSFVSNFQSSVVPNGKRWIQLKSGPSIDEDGIDDNDRQLDAITKKLFAYLHTSNFSTESATAFSDLCVGTGALLIQKGTKDNPFVFHAVPIKELTIEKGANGRVRSVFRCHHIKPDEIKELWPDAKLGGIGDLDQDKKHEIVELTEPHQYQRTNKNGEKETIDGYKYTVILKSKQAKLVEREQQSSPWVVFRWNVTPGEVWGRGPVLQALPDIKSLNRIKELLLRRAELDTFPVYTYLNEGVVNAQNLALKPHTFIPVEFNGGALGNAIQPLPIPGQMNLTQFSIQELRMSINKIMLAEPLGDVNLPVKSPTEVVRRSQEWLSLTGSAFGRIHYEFVIPLVQRLLFIMEELGLIDMGGFIVDGQIINISYESPIVQQERQEDFQRMQLWLQMLNQMYGQLSLGLTEPDKVAILSAELLGVPLEAVPTKEKFEELKQQLAAQAQQMQAQQQSGQEGGQQGGLEQPIA